MSYLYVKWNSFGLRFAGWYLSTPRRTTRRRVSPAMTAIRISRFSA
ncbi:MAG: hypothetical protein QOJ41_624 [Acidobacteriaceae bacterium]|jgi:hypothetical protein|nr:hypothetical protein [Acidobacteriaceae bacterium]